MKVLLSSICLETGTDIQLALYYLKSYLLKSLRHDSHVQVQVFNENQNVSTIATEIRRSSPQIIGFSCYVWNINKTLQVCRVLRKIHPGVKIVLGGPEVSPIAGELLAREKSIDFIVRGEGEITFAHLVEKISAPDSELSLVAGISFRNGKDIVHTLPRPHLSNLGIIPSPYLCGLVNLRDKNIIDVPLETARGCAYRCHYCYYHKNFPEVKYFPLSRIDEEFKLILAHKPPELYIMDATFNANPARAKRILRMFIKHNQGTDLHVELRAELIDNEMAKLLVRARAYNIEIGIQSTHPKTLRALNRSFNKEKFARGIGLLNKYKLYYEIQLIDALPFQRYEDLLKSLDWLYALHPSKVVIFPLTLLPGTTLRQQAAHYGIEYNSVAPYNALRSSVMSVADVVKIEHLRFAMERLFDSGIFQTTLYALCSRTRLRVTEVLEDWIRWESRFKRHGYQYVEFLNKKLPDFLEYVCRRHGMPLLYKNLLPGLREKLSENTLK